MITHIYRMEMRRNLKSFLIWTAVIVVCVAGTFGVIPTFMQTQDELLSAYPQDIMQAMGIDSRSWSSPLGVYASYYVFFLPLFGAIYAISLGSSIIAREEERKTAEFLLVKPLSRTSIVLAKVLAFISFTTILWVGTSFVEVAGLVAISDGQFDFTAYITMSVYGYLTLLLFGSLGMAVSLLVRRGRSVLGFGIGVVIVSYLFVILGKLSDKGAQAARISPFYYLDTAVTRVDYGMEVANVAYFSCIILFCLAASFAIYKKKDIYL